ncbi:MAG: SDR family oxidoreductase [Polyangiaceae bacterium]|nr:SDR family oxidoreductase [Polyangiaceae bacterium]
MSDTQTSARSKRPSLSEPLTVVVTGASSGIGRAVAEAYVRRGARVVLVGRDETKLRSVVEGLDASERTAGVAGDIADVRTVDRTFEVTRERFQRVDVLVNSAGIFVGKPFCDYEPADLDLLVGTNLRGLVLASQAAVRDFRRGGRGGAIVNVSAALALQPFASIPASVAMAVKSAVNGLTQSLALELAPEQITVNAVAPGTIKTPLIGPPAGYEALAGGQPMGHIGEPEDVVDAVIYLASARFVTGVVLPVDGGMTTGHW